jgi:hypothetical protein
MLPQIIIASLCILITLIGVLKKNRVYFNIGYFVYGLIVVFSELGFFAEKQDMIHLAVASLWVIQSVLTIPNKLPYDGGKLAKSAAVKIYSSLAIINLFGAYIVCESEIPDFVSYFHMVLAVLPLVAIYMVVTNKVATDI